MISSAWPVLAVHICSCVGQRPYKGRCSRMPGATEVLACRVKVIRDNREIPSALATDA